MKAGGNVTRARRRCGRPAPSCQGAHRNVQRPIERKTRALRNRIERLFNEVKNSRRVATCYDKLTSGFFGFVQLATIRIWIWFVHTA